MINIYSQSGQVTYGIIYYTVDTENEKNSLPTKDKMGSKCYVIESETWYILNGNGEWVPFVGEDSTAGGSGDVTPAAVVAATGQMSYVQKAQTRTNLNVQDTLVSGTNIKTINNQSILGSGNINISGGEAINVGNIQFDLVEGSE